MTNGLPTPNERALHSWKEIASYTGRGVRTIQRYEVKLAFPIRRPAGTSRSAVLAFPHEIDQWLAKSPTKLGETLAEPLVPERLSSEARATVLHLHSRAVAQRERAAEIAQRLRETQELVNRMASSLAATRATRKTVASTREQLHTSIAVVHSSISPGGGGRKLLATATAPSAGN